MNQVEENGFRGVQVAEEPPKLDGSASQAPEQKKPVTPATDKQKPLWKNNGRLVLLGAGLLVLVVLLLFGIRNAARTVKSRASYASPRTGQTKGKPPDTSTPAPNNVLPVLEANHPPQAESGASLTTPEQIAQTAKKQAKPSPVSNLGAIPPFDGTQPWQPAPYQLGLQPPSGGEDAVANRDAAETRNEHDSLDKPSLVFVKSSTPTASRSTSADIGQAIDWGIGLLPGTKLRARLESAVNTAVQTPVVAVIEYNYEHNGEIVVPAGSKAFGRLEAADRSGYVGVRFNSLMLPDGSSVNLEASATDLNLRPLHGKVEGKNTGKNILVRSFAGVGEVAATIVGRGSLNQPLSEADLLRAQVTNNIGQASDQTVANLAITERIVVSVPAGTEIYVVLQKPAKEGLPNQTTKAGSQPSAGQPSIQELRQLLQLQKELSQSASAEGTSQ